MGANVGLC